MKKYGWILILILLVTLVSTVVGASAFAEPSDGTVWLSAEYLLEAAGVEVGETELPYLAGKGVRYDPRIPASAITVHAEGEGLFRVEARPVVKDNLTWTPALVRLSGVETPFVKEGNSYVCTLSASEEDALTVQYQASLTVGKDVLTSYANSAYQAALTYNKQQVDWDREYEIAWEAYRQYQAYLTAKEAYDRYKAYDMAYRAWSAADGRYQAYLADYQTYLADYRSYTDYQATLTRYGEDLAAYQAYLAEAEAYPAKVEAYRQYLANKAIADRQVALVECIKTHYTDLERSVYDAVMGSAVTEVLRESEVLTSNAVGVDKNVILAARGATIKLREWFSTYFGYDNDQQKYGYYSANYQALISNWQTLLGALENLYGNKKVALYIRQMDKERKYMILLAELAVIGNALNDNPQKNYAGQVSYLDDWKLNKQTAKQILGGEIVKDLNNATPLAGGYPREVSEPVPPQVVAEPTMPAPVAQPTPPLEVPDPGEAPQAVPVAGKPTPVAEASEPTRKTLGEEEQALVNAYKDKTLVRRTVSEDLTLTLSTTVDKQVVAESITVTFRVEGREDYVVTADRGSFVEYGGETPARAPDVGAYYQFDYWIDGDGQPFDLSAVDQDVVVYPHFDAITRLYTAIWLTPQGDVSAIVSYGDAIVPPLTPAKKRDGNVYYTFAGWMSDSGRFFAEGDTMVGNVVYFAQFLPHTVVSEEDGKVDIRTQDERLVVDCTDNSRVEASLGEVANLARDEDKNLSVMLSGVTVDIPDYLLADFAGQDRSIEWYSLSRDKYCAEYRLDVTDWQGNLDVEVFTDLPEGAKLLLVDGDEEREVAYTRTQEGIAFSATAGATYRYVMQYAVSVIKPPLGMTLEVTPTLAYPEDTVIVTVSVPDGIRLTALKMSVDGSEEEIGSRFVMPRGNVTVWAEGQVERYTVTFLSDGVELDVQTATYGETITPPIPPERASDQRYSYTFAGWDKEVVPVTGDAVYTARYTSTPVVEPPLEEGRYGKKFKLILGLGIAAVVVISLAVVGVVVWAILRQKRRKKRV